MFRVVKSDTLCRPVSTFCHQSVLDVVSTTTEYANSCFSDLTRFHKYTVFRLSRRLYPSWSMTGAVFVDKGKMSYRFPTGEYHRRSRIRWWVHHLRQTSQQKPTGFRPGVKDTKTPLLDQQDKRIDGGKSYPFFYPSLSSLSLHEGLSQVLRSPRSHHKEFEITHTLSGRPLPILI